MGQIYSFPLHTSRVVLLLLRQHLGRGSELSTAAKYVRKTTSGAAGIGLGTTIKYPRRTTAAAAGSGWAPRPTTCAAPRAAAGCNDQVPVTHSERRRGQRPGAMAKYLRRTKSSAAGNGLGTTINELSPAMHKERRRGQWLGHHDQVPATHNERRRGQRPGAAAKHLRCTTSGAAGNSLGTTTKFQRAAAGIGLGTTAKYLRGAAGIGFGTKTTFLRRSTSGVAGGRTVHHGHRLTVA
jgi:hypothetical protein